MRQEDDWADEYKAALGRLVPSATFDVDQIRDRVARTIAADGPSRGWNGLGRWLGFAAGIALFGTGVVVGRVSVGSTPSFDPSPTQQAADVEGLMTEQQVTVEPVGDAIIIGLNQAFRRSETATDDGLGLTLQCTGCEWSPSDPGRLSVPEYPVVASIAPGGVAHEAGLQVGDVLQEINGRDVRSRAGAGLLLEPPRGDFDVSFVREGRVVRANLNRRVQDIRVDQRVHDIRRQTVTIGTGGRAWPSRILAAIRSWWAGVTSDDDAGGDDR